MGVGFEVGIANVGGPYFKVIEFSHESEEANATKGDNT